MEKRQRIWELDLLKGIALLLMIYFHIIYDLKELFHYPVDYESGFNYYAGKTAGTLFIFTAGVSTYLTRSNVRRALKILVFALLITLITYWYNPALVVTFGILHFLAAGIFLAVIFRNFPVWLLVFLGLGVILLKQVISGLSENHDWFLFFMLGLSTESFTSSDYYPLIPWYGVFLLGMAAGRGLYGRGYAGQKKSLFSFRMPDNFLLEAGRHTLIIYLVHQPVIVALLSLLIR